MHMINIDSSKFAKSRMSTEFNSRNNSHLTKFEQGPQILETANLRDLRDSMLSGLCTFDNMVISLSQRRGKN